MAVLVIKTKPDGINEETLSLDGVSLSYETKSATEIKGSQQGYTCDGSFKSFSNRVYKDRTLIQIQNISREKYKLFRTFLEEKIRFTKNRFSVEIDSLNLNVTNCFFSEQSSSGLYLGNIPDTYTVTFEFTSLRE
jgi:hypothetical protein